MKRKLIEQIAKIKSAAEGIEYKLDANAIEIGNAKHEFNDLADAVNRVLAFDFAEEVKNFKTELYASKEDLSSAIDLMQNELSEKVTNDLFGKYELLVSKLDNVEDELKYAQKDSLNGLNAVLSNISSSIVDILSYVSAVKEANNDAIEAKLSEVTTFIQDNNLNYIESVRDIVDVVRVQVEEYLNRMGNDSNERFTKISSAISEKCIGSFFDSRITKILSRIFFGLTDGHLESPQRPFRVDNSLEIDATALMWSGCS